MRKLSFLPVILALVMLSCSNNSNTDDDDDNNNNDPFSLTTLSYVDCKLDGQALLIKSPTDGSGYVTSGTSLSPDPNISSTAVYGGGVKPNSVNVTNAFEFNKGTLSWPGQTGYPDDAVFTAFFPKNTTGTFSVDAVNGWEFKYYDANGTLWSTSLGSGNQSGSSISIVEKAETDAFGEYYVNLKIEFNCTVYDGNGNSKVITEGESVVGFQSI